jgi:hypothetical protein
MGSKASQHEQQLPQFETREKVTANLSVYIVTALEFAYNPGVYKLPTGPLCTGDEGVIALEPKHPSLKMSCRRLQCVSLKVPLVLSLINKNGETSNLHVFDSASTYSKF